MTEPERRERPPVGRFVTRVARQDCIIWARRKEVAHRDEVKYRFSNRGSVSLISLYDRRRLSIQDAIGILNNAPAPLASRHSLAIVPEILV